MNENNQSTEGQVVEKGKVGGRAAGVLLTVFGAVVSYFFIYMPIHHAQEHAKSVSDSSWGIVGPSVLVFGVLLLLFPKLETAILKDNKKLSLVGWALVVVLGGIGFGVYYWFEQKLAAYGYKDCSGASC